MKSCPKCGSVCNYKNLYCTNCGAKLKAPLPISVYLTIIAIILVIFGVNIVVNIISIIISIMAIVYSILKENKTKWSIVISIYCIIASLIWIMFNFIN